MGARINYVFNDGTEHSVVLYSHWGETNWEESIAAAIRHARPRWQDTSYATRMMISYLIQHEILDETGYGIFAVNSKDFMAWDTTIEIDMVNNQIDNHTFEEFCNYHLGADTSSQLTV